MSVSINGTGGITFADASTQSTGGYTGFRNRIINGAMMIDQRNAGASVTPSTGTYTVDRWRIYASQSSKLTAQQNAGSVTPPVGFTNYLGITSSSAYSVLSGDLFLLQQFVEGFNVSDLAWGTANAQPITISFVVRSSLTGTFGVTLQNSAGDRVYPFTYTISSANTWETKSVTIAGDTTGTWLTNNGKGIVVSFGLGVGSTASGTAGSWQSAGYYGVTGATSVVGTNGATFYITGVQLEKGSVATPFEFRQYGTELQLCQRYYYRNSPGASNSPLGAGTVVSGTVGTGITQFPVAMRTAPSALEQTGTASDYNTSHAGSSYVNNAVPTFVSANTYIANTQFANGGTMISGGAVILRTNSTTGYLGWSAEL